MLGHVRALNYHELVPDHHLHLTRMKDFRALHPLRKHAFFKALNDGWAPLPVRWDVIEHLKEHFSRLMMDAFLTCWLVVGYGDEYSELVPGTGKGVYAEKFIHSGNRSFKGNRPLRLRHPAPSPGL